MDGDVSRSACLFQSRATTITEQIHVPKRMKTSYLGHLMIFPLVRPYCQNVSFADNIT